MADPLAEFADAWAAYHWRKLVQEYARKNGISEYEVDYADLLKVLLPNVRKRTRGILGSKASKQSSLIGLLSLSDSGESDSPIAEREALGSASGRARLSPSQKAFLVEHVVPEIERIQEQLRREGKPATRKDAYVLFWTKEAPGLAKYRIDELADKFVSWHKSTKHRSQSKNK